MRQDIEQSLGGNIVSLVNAIDENIAHDARVSVLEAGGGSASYMRYVSKLSNAHITTIDIDPDQIRNNQYANEKILGDLHSYRLPEGKFDLVVCYNVLEHLVLRRSLSEA
jgi:2-polyprenyl-3-methyl-5-hydroxy-6-metoxy-1,4-benzoquinol methylase